MGGMRLKALLLAVSVWVAVATAQNLPLPALPYEYDALEPVVDERTMREHHLKHHQSYTNKMNAALSEMRAQPDTKPLVKRGVDYMLRHLEELPERYADAMRKHGGGYVNHELFWSVMQPPSEEDAPLPAPREGGRLLARIEADFGSLDEFRKEFSDAALALFGSGWAWLSVGEDGRLVVSTTANQDSPAMTKGDTPLLALDLWEHAYYLLYRSDRRAYIGEWWRVVNWTEVERRFEAAPPGDASRDDL